MNTELKFKNLIELTEYFSDTQTCVDHLEKLRWNGQRCCVHCGSTKTYVCKGFGKYKCGDCKSRFSVTSKTFFEASKISLSKWFIAMYLCLSHKKGVSSVQLAIDLGVTQKTAWFILHRIRVLVCDRSPELLEGVVELDETYIGGRDKNKSLKKRREQKAYTQRTGKGWRSEKAMVAGAVERGGRLVLKHIPNVQPDVLVPFVHDSVKKDSTIYTDELGTYTQTQGYTHETVKHSNKEYVRGKVHTNTIEGAWSLFKRSIYGIHHQVSKKHLQKYAVAFAFRYSTRKHTEQERFDIALTKCNEGRLRYSELIKSDSVSMYERNKELGL